MVLGRVGQEEDTERRGKTDEEWVGVARRGWSEGFGAFVVRVSGEEGKKKVRWKCLCCRAAGEVGWKAVFCGEERDRRWVAVARDTVCSVCVAWDVEDVDGRGWHVEKGWWIYSNKKCSVMDRVHM